MGIWALGLDGNSSTLHNIINERDKIILNLKREFLKFRIFFLNNLDNLAFGLYTWLLDLVSKQFKQTLSEAPSYTFRFGF